MYIARYIIAYIEVLLPLLRNTLIDSLAVLRERLSYCILTVVCRGELIV